MAEETEHLYQKRVRAWVLYDWANSAFATTVLTAVLPVYYGKVAGVTLPSLEVATTYWMTGLIVSLAIIAVLSPILGTISDVMRGKKRLLAITAGVGIIATGLLVLVDRGDWMLASILFIVGRLGFATANVFYDALLPHVARADDQDRVSTRGYAAGYLGGGILLAVNAAMIFAFPDNWGVRLSFVTVAIWWAIFTIPILRHVPEPATAVAGPAGRSLIGESFARLGQTFRNLGRYRELSRFLVAFLLYNDGIGTIITVAAIYMTALRFEPMQIILAILLVQFVGIPFSLMLGRVPNPNEKRRAFFLTVVLVNVICLPVIGLLGRQILPDAVSGNPSAPYAAVGGAVGERAEPYEVAVDDVFEATGFVTTPRADLSPAAAGDYAFATEPGSRLVFRYHGQDVEVVHARGPGHGAFALEIDGESVTIGKRPVVALTGEAPRYEEVTLVRASSPGVHTLVLVTRETPDGARVGVRGLRVLPPKRESNLLVIIGLLLGLQIVAFGVAFLVGDPLLGPLARYMTTKGTILFALGVYAGVAMWAYVLDSVLEFWALSWLVAVVQGGSQALSRSLYARMSPRAMSGEFFGFFTIMSKFSAMLGPLVFAVVLGIWGDTRPAVLSVAIFFVVGAGLLLRVDTEEGERVAREADAAASGGES